MSSGDFGGALVASFALVTASAPFVPGPIVHPRQACRLGGFGDPGFADMIFLPFPDLLGFWGSYGRYQACVAAAEDSLESVGLWDREVAASVSDRAVVRASFVGARPDIDLARIKMPLEIQHGPRRLSVPRTP